MLPRRLKTNVKVIHKHTDVVKIYKLVLQLELQFINAEKHRHKTKSCFKRPIDMTLKVVASSS